MVLNQKNSNQKYFVNSVIDAFRILEMLDKSQRPLKISQIAKELDEGKSKVFRFMTTLKHLKYVDQNPETKEYTLSTNLIKLGNFQKREFFLISLTSGSLDYLGENTEETINLSILDGTEVLYLAKRDSPFPFRMCVEVGGRAPVYSTALGKALVSYCSPLDLERLLPSEEPYKKYTQNTVSTRLELETHLGKVRQEGVAFDNEEMFLGLRCIAVPIFQRGKVVAAISISSPSSRLNQTRLIKYKELLIAESKELNKKLDVHELLV